METFGRWQTKPRFRFACAFCSRIKRDGWALSFSKKAVFALFLQDNFETGISQKLNDEAVVIISHLKFSFHFHEGIRVLIGQ